LTVFNSPTRFIVGLIVVAIAAGASEELLFRGVLQNILYKTWNNPHVAIWVAAFWFSFIHFQFYGFVPRMLLGAMFGYIYYWTKNLWLSMFAHFVNNGFTLLMVYLYQIKWTKTDIEKVDDVSWQGALSSLLITIVLTAWIYKRSQNQKIDKYEGLEKDI